MFLEDVCVLPGPGIGQNRLCEPYSGDMEAHAHLAAVAFTYAWWLTGDDEQAAAAIRAAATEQPELWSDDALPELLAAVRRIAAPLATMCPASELALLHDGQGLALDRAAELCEVPAAEARTELAHGRLEALAETVVEPFEHPERLGGLAVGNPPDVAHARTCPSCADASALLRKGREELTALPEVAPPVGLVEALGLAEAPARTDAQRIIDLTSVEGAPLEEEELEALAPAPADRRIGVTVLAVLAVLIGLVILGISARTGGTRTPETPAGSAARVDAADDRTTEDGDAEVAGGGVDLETGIGRDAQPEGDGAPQEEADDPEEAADVPALEPDLPAEPEDGALAGAPQVDGFALTRARLVSTDTDSAQGAAIGPADPLRVAVDYAAADGVELEAVLDLADGTSTSRRVVVSGIRSTHVFVWRAPAGGWPEGRHEVQLLAEGALIGLVDVVTA